MISYKKIIRDGLLAGACVVPIYYILAYALRYGMLYFDASYAYEPNWAFAIGLGLGNTIVPMITKYHFEKMLQKSKERWKERRDEIKSIIEITEEIEVEE